MKVKLTLSIDPTIAEEAKVQGINISAAAEQGISAVLGRSKNSKIQRGENGELIMAEEVRKDLKIAYDKFEEYINQLGVRYDHRKGMIWIYNHAIRAGMDTEELLNIFEGQHTQQINKHAQMPKLEVSQEATDKLMDIYFKSFCIFVDHLLRNYHANQDLSDSMIKTVMETDTSRWIMERRKRLTGISRKDLYVLLKERYNDEKGKQLL